MDHYETLGIAPDADVEQIRQAYLAAARVSHPDFHDDDEARRVAAEHRMRELNLAWGELSDPRRRARYDAARGDPTESRWRPYDSSPDPGFDERHDRPITDAGIPGWLRLAPALAFAGGVVCVVLGGFTGTLPIVAVGLFAMLASVGLFVVAALVALTSSHRRSPLGESR